MKDRIKLNHQFRMVYSRGKCQSAPTLVTYVLPRRNGGVHIGITSGKKIGGAVVRNRARRVIAAAWRSCQAQLKPDLNAMIVFVARSKTAPAKSTEVAEVMLKHLKAAGVVGDEQ